MAVNYPAIDPLSRNGYPMGDAGILISAGAYPGVTTVNKFGENTDVATDTTETIWAGSNIYPFPSTAVITHVSQKVNQAAMTGETVHVMGLDANWEKTHQDVVLNASDTTTPVALATPLIRVFRAYVKANVVTDQTITIHNAANNVDYAYITAGENQTTMAIYTVPAGHTAYLTNYYTHHHPATNQNPTSLDINLWGQDNANGWAPRIQHTVGVPTGGGFAHQFYPFYKFTEKTDIYITATTVGKAAHVSGGFDLILVDNSSTHNY